MTLQELQNEVLSAAISRPSYIRLGQFVFNYIDEHYGVARAVQFIDRVDCFYDDSQIDSFLAHCLARINSYPRT